MIVVYLTYFCYLAIYTHQLTRVYEVRKHYAYSVALLLLFTLSNSTLLIYKSIFKIWFVLILEILYFILQFRLNAYKGVLLSIFFNFSTMIAEFFSTAISAFLYNFSTSTSFFSWKYILGCVLNIIIAFLIQNVILKWLKIMNNKEKNTIEKAILLCFPLSTLYWCIYLLNPYTIVKNRLDLFTFFLLLVISNFVLLYFYAKSLTAQQLKEELYKTRQKEQIVKEKYDILSKQYHQSYTYLHVLIHTCSHLKDLANEKDYNGINDCVSILANKTSETFNLLCSNSLPLNMVLNAYKNQLYEYHIVVNTTILDHFAFLSEEKEFELYDILIESCIENCKNSKSRFISISLKRKNTKLYLKVMCPSGDYASLELFCKENGILLTIFKEHEINTLMLCQK